MRKGDVMTKQIGLWIDHKRTVIVSIDEDGESIQKIESGVENVSYRGGAQSRIPYNAKRQPGDDREDNYFTVHFNKYYDKVIEQIRDAKSLLIIGPGEAKLEFKKRMEHEKVPVQIVGVEPADKMTDRQIAAKFREHFQKSGTRV
jgi:stalled ribosome rescue protein Dom34